jgi:NADPH:quinone reductase-like Zn-dependent oxidoreductase
MPYSRCESALAPRGVYLTAVPMPETMLHMLRTPVVDGRKIGFAAPGLMRARRKQRDLIFVTELVEAGEIKSFMDRIYPLKQIAEAHRYVEKGHKKGNVVITVGDDSEAPRGEA